MKVSRQTLVTGGILTALLGQFVLDRYPTPGIILLGLALALGLVEGWYFPANLQVIGMPVALILLLGFAFWREPRGWFFIALGAIEIGTSLRGRQLRGGVEHGESAHGGEPGGEGDASLRGAAAQEYEPGGEPGNSAPVDPAPGGEPGNSAPVDPAPGGEDAGGPEEVRTDVRPGYGASPAPWPEIPPQDQPLYLKGALYGLVVAAAGAYAWFFVTTATGYALGFLAWLVGRFVGRSVLWGAGGRGDRTLQVIAAVLGGVGILGGYYLIVRDQLVKVMVQNGMAFGEGRKFVAIVALLISHPEIIGVFGLVFTAFGIYDAYRGAGGRIVRRPRARDIDMDQSGR